MKNVLLSILTLVQVSMFAQTKVTWFSSNQTTQWKQHQPIAVSASKTKADVLIQPAKTLQTIEGFGTCFNELGWTSLSMLSEKDRESILQELFTPNKGANFTICRMPIGANDFSQKWYSYNETAGDFEMKNFSIANDFKTLIPFIKNAQKYNPSLKLWASPWSPPSWMKYNKHYAAKSFPKKPFKSEQWGMDFTGLDNGLTPENEGKEGTDMFIQEDKYYQAYALYFRKFIEAYRQQKINISMVMPQNEFNSAQVFPSCTWTATGLSKFVSYLGPQMEQAKAEIFFGTMERADAKLVDTLLQSSRSAKYIKGVGFQWAGKGAIESIHKNYPNLPLYQSEQECGNGTNSWEYCAYTWGLMKHYLSNGANAYMYWNTSLKQGGISTWGWHQNSLVSVDTVKKTYKYNYEYYMMKHLSHFVKKGAKRLATSGEFNNLLAFVNPDKSIVIIAQNESKESKTVTIQVGNRVISPVLDPDSYNTLLIK